MPVISVSSTLRARSRSASSNAESRCRQSLKRVKSSSSAALFFADPAANPDRFDHVRAGDRDGSLWLAWEDLLGGGDRDYNDMVLTIRAIRPGR